MQALFFIFLFFLKKVAFSFFHPLLLKIKEDELDEVCTTLFRVFNPQIREHFLPGA